ncbi:GNAT family N-acetyltransferase [Rossellomorea aquimaris]|jgi:GNAT superfamily N-acetyltransferase|uniref:GNAT family N-acetyltransferase n=1 Tax=Rossellomorea aquimaris TaxID=189382 RepID=A0A1J6WUX6_9BACI|nr:GNAT family N-acetyltransferase [Rossellomorea aquimaris]OIU72027.1 GNAT family N-acetyltransferase [Rossellomorea aquimaris]
MTVIKELKFETDWLEAYPLMKQLRTHLDRDQYLELIKDAAASDGYQLAALYNKEKIVSVTGFMPMITLYNGKFIWVCDLVTDANERSQGHGQELLLYVEKWARSHGYERISLSSGLQRIDAHRFYEEKMDYQKKSFVFLKDL